MLSYNDIEEIKQAGFIGFKTVAEMKSGGCRNLPLAGGVYMIIRPIKKEPYFLQTGSGGHFKGKDPNVSIEELRANWVDDTSVLYIGKATSLKKRLSQYMSFGRGSNVGHWGGRLIWQLADVDEMLVCWKETSEVPRKVEEGMIADFKLKYGQWPFANLQD